MNKDTQTRRRILVRALELADLGVVVLAAVVASLLTWAGAKGAPGLLSEQFALGEVLLVLGYLFYWHLLLRGQGLYQSHRLSPSARELKQISMATLFAIAPLFPLSHLVGDARLDLLTVEIFSLTAFVGLCAERRALRALARRLRMSGRNLREVMIIGEGRDAFSTAADLAKRESLGYSVKEIIDVTTGDGLTDEEILANVEEVLAKTRVDEVFLALPLDRASGLLAAMIEICDAEGIAVRVLSKLAALEWANASIDTLMGQPVITITSAPRAQAGLAAKRLLDVVGAAALMAVLAPMMALIALAVRIDSRGPVFFSQPRVGLNRKRFNAHKFRTMVPDAPALQASLEHMNEADGPVFKIENDPRITRVGRILRKTSLDELPQLWNVLMGEMSLVGPRPLPVRDVDLFETRWHRRRHSVKPGLTCLWQVRSRTPQFDEWIRSDMEYIDNWSLGLDLRILFQTVPAVLSGQGAH